MSTRPVRSELYSPREIARAAGVPLARAAAALGSRHRLVPHAAAVEVARALRQSAVEESASRAEALFSVYDLASASRPGRSVPLAVSSTLHALGVSTALFLTTIGVASSDRVEADLGPAQDMRLVFISSPGPGGGGGGGGTLQLKPAPKALRAGTRRVSSPLPERTPPPEIAPAPAPRDPEPPALNAEALPVVAAPLIVAPADARDRAGVLHDARGEAESRGSGQGGGAGSGSGTGLGSGDGAGVGPGSGGGTGGGPYRPGAGIEPPRLLREVRADYTEAGRRAGVNGDVVLEIVVRHDGSVGDVRVVRRLGSGLDERAVQAVRQWRFSPARRQGVPVDVIVEVAVEFRLR
jgi:TonB family protein